VSEVAYALLRLLNRGSFLRIEHDPERPSPCELLPPDHHNMVEWRPVPMEPPAAFDGVEVHPSVREFYGSYWGGEAGGRHSGEAVCLRVAWNADELTRITSYVMSQVEAGEPVMVAYTDSDWYFGVDNATGVVWLCEPGRPAIREAASSLVAFLDGVE